MYEVQSVSKLASALISVIIIMHIMNGYNIYVISNPLCNGCLTLQSITHNSSIMFYTGSMHKIEGPHKRLESYAGFMVKLSSKTIVRRKRLVNQNQCAHVMQMCRVFMALN